MRPFDRYRLDIIKTNIKNSIHWPKLWCKCIEHHALKTDVTKRSAVINRSATRADRSQFTPLPLWCDMQIRSAPHEVWFEHIKKWFRRCCLGTSIVYVFSIQWKHMVTRRCGAKKNTLKAPKTLMIFEPWKSILQLYNSLKGYFNQAWVSFYTTWLFCSSEL